LHIRPTAGFRFTVDRTINGKRGGQAVAAQRADEGRCFPVPMRHGGDQAMAAFCPAIVPRHVGLHRAFINENKLRCSQFRLLLAPFSACLGHVITILLGRVEGLFLNRASYFSFT
jgi:hypothetical protein